MKMMEAIYKSTMEEVLTNEVNRNYLERTISTNLKGQIEPTSSHIGNSKEVVEEFTNLNGDFSKRLPMKPLLSTKPKEDNVSSDDSDETKESNKKKRKNKKAITRDDIASDSE
ncbi:unnamed protein product [Rhizophagus irregularis]|nr:unnamed protein product [Rhizophagus irregularis]CAB4440455.1 unnamed protein product [Rhizophagus irregularis]